MLLADFIEAYGPTGASVDIESCVKVLDSVFKPTRIYKNPDGILAVFDRGDYSTAYLIFARFSKQLVTLIRDSSSMEHGELIAETKDHRIAKLLGRFGFVVMKCNEGTETLKRGKYV